MIVSDMLPELLFSVGSGMQDFGKDELGGLLGTGVVVSSDKDHGASQHTLHSAANGGVGLVVGIDDIKLTSIPDLLETSDGGKLEEVDRDLYPWHTGPNIGSRFLRSSDDPLISGGTNDNPHDNELSVPTVSQSMCPSPTTPPPAPKHRHSSVLPPELAEPILSPLATTPPKKTPDASAPSPSKPATTSNRRSNTGAPRARRKGPLKLRFHHQALPQEYLDHYEATQNNLHKKEAAHGQAKSTTRQPDRQSAKALMERQAVLEREERANESVRSWLQKILELQQEGVPMAPLKDEPGQSTAPTPPTNTAATDGSPQKRIVSYTDLPYMGEITLDNCKPRRGRKPKKADICHLIYKNYGTILPGTPTRELTLEKVAKGCSKSVASLLERRLTASDERAKGQPTGQLLGGGGQPRQSPKRGLRKEEPLNLCVRDSGGDSVALSLSSDPDTDPEEDPFASSCPTPIITPSDLCTDQALATNMKLSLPTLQSSSGSTTETPSTADTPPGYMYWSSANAPTLFAHPMGMYFPAATTTASVPELADGSPASSPAVSPNGLKGDHQRPAQPLLVPKHISQLIKPTKPQPPAATAPTGQRRTSPIPKRKRSAIFIPPVPAENSSNPATEVSICKFKFTGGAKPCLQEKKILSVDSGGNFRYYSGTGDKSMRGYEFFPRESLQQSSITATSTTGAFLNASGERIACDLPPPSLGLSNDLLQIPDFPTSPPHPCSPITPAVTGCGPHHHHTASERRRRKSRRATQRESLEKTFKEKGFLIQTQQMQSAEGATYCKFRQLRKFTRYLFRSWKDYLPGDLQQQSDVLPGVTLPPPTGGGMSEDFGSPPERLVTAFDEAASSSSFSSPSHQMIVDAATVDQHGGSISSTVRSRFSATQQLQHSEPCMTDPGSSPGPSPPPPPRRVD
ncbi:uncharacterized protein LOC131215028 [Anopheles bellator]|uniref:uncharacterized protein LOC131215028 n=1 Tax=Anopheles bellator TaxID=139047 RepID=UPI00264A03FD|nr:uncharacterized protein LOC131215028 [Anopheles bellator]